MTVAVGPARDDGPGAGALFTRALVIKLALLALVIAAAKWYPADARYVAERTDGTPEAVWYLARGWDAGAYQGLAEHGYTNAFSKNYPLGYPALIRALTPLAGGAATAAVLASNLCALLAVALFLAVAGRYAAATGRRRDLALTLFACTPGLLAFGTVAYSEAPFMVVTLLAWLAYLRADGGAGATAAAGAAAGSGAASGMGVAAAGGRPIGWLLLAGLLAGAGVMVKHLGGALLLGLALIETWRGIRAPARGATRGRAVLEAACVLWTVPLVAWYFAWKFQAHDLAGLQQDIWSMRFVPLGGLPSLVALDTAPEYLAQIVVTLPLAALLIVKLRAVDARLAVISLAFLFVALSFTGIAAQSITRYTWTVWPLSLGALALDDRATGWALCGVLFCVSAWCATGHVLGTAAF